MNIKLKKKKTKKLNKIKLTKFDKLLNYLDKKDLQSRYDDYGYNEDYYDKY
jgi:hypothetical protein